MCTDMCAGTHPIMSTILSSSTKKRTPHTSKNQPATPRIMGLCGRPADGKPVFPGDIFLTISGRVTTPYPSQKSEKYASQWLIDNATAEARSFGDEGNALAFEKIIIQRKGDLIVGDRDTMLMRLFEYQPPRVPKILKNLVAAG